MLFELVEGFFVNPKTVAVVKATGEDGCVLFTSGQSAVDGGFTLPSSAERVAEEINDADEEEEDDEGDEEDEDEEDEDD